MTSTPISTNAHANVCLPIQPVLRQGLIIFAYPHVTGVRVVTFEDPTVKLEWHPSESHFDREKSVFVGQGTNISAALTEALHVFHDIDINDHSHPLHRESPIRIKHLLAKLDDWLITREGTLRSVSDFDGSTIVRLEGSTNPLDGSLQIIVLESSGSTFYKALASVLSKSIDQDHSAVVLKRIKIHTSNDDQQHTKRIIETNPVEAEKKTSNLGYTIIFDKRKRLP